MNTKKKQLMQLTLSIAEWDLMLMHMGDGPKIDKIKSRIEKRQQLKDRFEGLAVTSCSVAPFKEPKGKTLAIARVCINDSLQLTGLRIVDGVNGWFVSYPLDSMGEDLHSLYYPLNKPLREHIEQAILEEYQRIRK